MEDGSNKTSQLAPVLFGFCGSGAERIDFQRLPGSAKAVVVGLN